MEKNESLIYGIMHNIKPYLASGEIQGAKQDITEVSGGRQVQNTIYTMKLLINKKPLVLTYKVGQDSIEVMLTDKNTGEMLEYLMHNGKSIEAVKKHNLTPAQVKKMLELVAKA